MGAVELVEYGYAVVSRPLQSVLFPLFLVLRFFYRLTHEEPCLPYRCHAPILSAESLNLAQSMLGSRSHAVGGTACRASTLKGRERHAHF